MEIGLTEDVAKSRLDLLVNFAANFFKNSVLKEGDSLNTIRKDVEVYKTKVLELKEELGHPNGDLVEYS
jgi:hypothetical protein